MRRQTTVVLALLSAFPLRAHAQGEVIAGGIAVGYTALSIGAIRALRHGCCAELIVGSDVRIITVDRAGTLDFSGTFLGADTDSITISMNGVLRRVPRADIGTIRVRIRETQWPEGWAFGLLAGGAAGVIGGFVSGDDPPNDDWFALTAPQKAVILGIAGGILGSSVGALVGLGTEGDRWRRVDPYAAAFRVTLRPIVGKSVGVGVNVAF